MAQNQGNEIVIKKDGRNLRLGGSQLTDEGRAEIEEAFSRNSSLVDFWIPKSVLVNDTIPGLCEMLQANTVLEQLFLSESVFSTEGLNAVLGAFCRNHSLSLLDLRACRLTDHDIPSLVQLLTNNSTLRALMLRESVFSTEGMNAVFSALSSNHWLLGLDLRGCRLTDEVTPSLVQLLTNNSTLRALMLRESVFSTEGMSAVFSALSSNLLLEFLDLRACRLTDHDIPSLVQLLTNNSTLHALQLSESVFSTEGMSAVFSALSSNHSLEGLDLGGCRLTDEVTPSLVQLLTNNSTLRDLMLKESVFSTEGMSAVFSALSSNHSLSHLDLRGCRLTDVVTPSLVQLLTNNSALQDLQLPKADLSDAATTQLLSALTTNNSLQYLSFVESAWSDRVVPALVKLASNNTTLVALQLLAATLSDDGAERLLDALCSNTSLTHLSFWASRWSDRVVPALVKLASTNTTLVSLQLLAATLSDDGAERLLDALCSNTSLTHLSLRESTLTDAVVPSLIHFLNKSKMLILQLNDSVFTDSGMESMMNALAQNQTLLYLGFWDSRLTDRVVPSFVNFLTHNQIINSTFSDHGLGQIMHALADNTSLQKLSLKYCKLTDQCAPAVANFLTSNTTLHTLQFSWCCFSDIAMEPILQELAVNRSLRTLSLFKNALSNKSAPAVALVARNSTLQNVRILGGEMSNENTERLLTALGEQQVLTDFRIDVGCRLTDASVVPLCEFLTKNQHKKTLVLRSKMTDTEVTNELTEYLRMDKPFSSRSKGKPTPMRLAVPLSGLDGAQGTSSDSGKASAPFSSAESDCTMPGESVHVDQEDLEEDEIAQTTSLQGIFSKLQVTPEGKLPAVVEPEGGESSGYMSPTSVDDDAAFGDVAGLPTVKKAAGLFFHNTGGELQLPDSDVLLHVPPGAVPPGKVYVIHGAIHTDVDEYSPWMASDDEHIVSPVVEYRTEGDQMFDKPVEITIPHYLRPNQTNNIHVLCGSGDEYRELLKTDLDTTFSVQPHFIRIQTCHFTKFIVTKSGLMEEIGEVLLTVAAKQMQTRTKSITCFRLVVHTGLTMLKDFAEQRKLKYDPSMKEIITREVVLHDEEEPVPVPDVSVKVNVTNGCDAVIKFSDTPKQTQLRKDGKDVLRLPYQLQNCSRTLGDVEFENRLGSQLECSLEISFEYKDDIQPIVHKLTILYPEKSEEEEESESHLQRQELSGDLTYKAIKSCLTLHRPMIYQRLKVSPMLLATLVAEEVLGPAETNELDVKSITKYQKVDIILNTIIQKDIKTFLDFCLVLAKPTIRQSHVVTDVMKLDLDYIHAQRTRFDPPAVDQPSMSAAASTSPPPLELSPTPAPTAAPPPGHRSPRPVPVSTSAPSPGQLKPNPSVRPKTAAASRRPHSGIPQPARPRPRKAPGSKPSSAAGNTKR